MHAIFLQCAYVTYEGLRWTNHFWGICGSQSCISPKVNLYLYMYFLMYLYRKILSQYYFLYLEPKTWRVRNFWRHYECYPKNSKNQVSSPNQIRWKARATSNQSDQCINTYEGIEFVIEWSLELWSIHDGILPIPIHYLHHFELIIYPIPTQSGQGNNKPILR